MVLVKGCTHYWWHTSQRRIITFETVVKLEAGCSLHWRHNDHDGASNHQPHGCLLNRLFGRISKKTSKLRVTCLCAGNSPGPVNSPHKGSVTRKMFPFDDVIMIVGCLTDRILQSTPQNSPLSRNVTHSNILDESIACNLLGVKIQSATDEIVTEMRVTHTQKIRRIMPY